MQALTIEVMNKLWPHGDSKIPGLRQAIIDHAPAVFAKWGFDTDDVVAIFMGQVSLECGAGTEVVENLNYTAKRMMAVWPSRFPTLASALPYASNPAKLAEKVYGSRGGNKPGTGMGAKYIGRGGSQTTFHDGYAALAEVTGLDLLDDPNLVNDPKYFLDCAAADFVKCGCLPFAKRGDIESVTHHLNGGLTGLSDRVVWTKRFRSAMAVQPVPKPVDDGILRLGSKGYEVTALENRLVELGYAVGAIDDQFGRAVRVAVIAFQLDRGLPGSGEVDDATKEALKRDLPKPVSEARMTATADDLRDSGSGTVLKADKVTWYGKIAAGLGLAGGGGHAAQTSGLLDTASGAADKVSTIRSVFDQVHDSLGWVIQTATTYWWLVAIVVGFLGIKFGGDIIKQRLEDHRTAVNMGR
jgi:putative chitinase